MWRRERRDPRFELIAKLRPRLDVREPRLRLLRRQHRLRAGIGDEPVRKPKRPGLAAAEDDALDRQGVERQLQFLEVLNVRCLIVRGPAGLVVDDPEPGGLFELNQVHAIDVPADADLDLTDGDYQRSGRANARHAEARLELVRCGCGILLAPGLAELVPVIAITLSRAFECSPSSLQSSAVARTPRVLRLHTPQSPPRDA